MLTDRKEVESRTCGPMFQNVMKINTDAAEVPDIQALMMIV